ncbi:hypothetical protein, partial [Rhodococcus sp. BS-15]|uniref:hypothetical protein n=1 Tax=Rhodococcus sp. BS-15 TaxID=1304954 RepID=UPI001F2B4BA6
DHPTPEQAHTSPEPAQRPLPAPHRNTGAGLEKIVVQLLQQGSVTAVVPHHLEQVLERQRQHSVY